MANEILLPDATLYSDWFRRPAGGTNIQPALIEGVATHDGDADYAQGIVPLAFARLSMANPTIGATYTRITVRIAARRQTSSGIQLTFGWEIGAQQQTIEVALPADWTIFEQAWSGAWSQDELDGLRTIFRYQSGSGEARVTAIEAEVSNGVQPSYDQMVSEEAYPLPRRRQFVFAY